MFSTSSRFLKTPLLLSIAFVISACGNSWAPTGGWQGAASPDCDAYNLERRLATMDRGDRQMAEASSFFQRCRKELAGGPSLSLVEMFKVAGIAYDYQKLPTAKKFYYKTKDGLKIRGTLFLKPGKSVRPLVLVKCGVQCDEDSSSLRHILMNLFDEGPFHVLLLPSFTGEVFQKENRILPVGGFDEGRHLIRIAKHVQSSDFADADRIRDVHVVGVSLGGHAALFSAVYGSHQFLSDGRPVIASVFAGCPAVDLEKSVTTLFSNQSGIIGRIFMKRFWDQINTIASYVPVLSYITEDRQRKRLREIPALIEKGALDYYKNVSFREDFQEIPLNGVRIRNRDDLWQANRFQDVAHLSKIPIYVWAAEDDRVVRSANNVAVLEAMNLPNVHTLNTPRGAHCAFSEAYNWRVMGSILRGILVSQSRGILESRKTRVQALQLKGVQHLDRRNDWVSPNPRRKHRAVQWRSVVGSSDVELIFYGKENCERSANVAKCEKGYSVAKVALKNVGLASSDTPRNIPSAEALTRWLNANVWVWGAHRGRLEPWESPQQVEWTRYEN